MKKFTDAFFSVTDRLTTNFIYIGGVMIVGVMIFTSVNSILRIFKYPIPGDVEIIESAQVIIIYATIACCVITNSHIKIDLLKKFSGLDHFNHFVAFAGAAFIAAQCFVKGKSFLALGTASQLLRIPRAPIVFFSGIGFLLFAVAVAGVEYRLIKSEAERRRQKHCSAGDIPSPDAPPAGDEGEVRG